MKRVITYLMAVLVLGCTTIDSSIEVENLDGYWELIGHGIVVEIRKSSVIKGWHITSDYTVPWDIGEYKSIIDLDYIDEDNLRIKMGSPVFTEYRAVPLYDWSPVEGNTKDPVYNFNVFWQTLNEFYPFFQRKGINWERVYLEYSSKINSDTTDKELYQYITEIMVKFNDIHLSVTNSRGEEWKNFNFMPDYFKDTLKDTVYLSTKAPYREGYWAYLMENGFLREILPVIKSYILEDDFKRAGNGVILYGKIGDRTGYINLLKTEDFSSNPEEPQDKSLELALDEVYYYFKDCETIVLDTRFNMGGVGYLREIISSRFTDKRFKAFSSSTRYKGVDSKPEEIYINPHYENSFAGKKIKVLVSPLTASAGEDLVISLRELDNVEVIGEATAGCLSGMLLKSLPNGWNYTLSYETAIGNSGEIFENSGVFGTGVEPDISIDFNSEDFTMRKVDPILERAIRVEGRKEVVVDPLPFEDGLKFIMAYTNYSLGFDSSGDLSQAPFGAFMYRDDNWLGSKGDFTLLSVAIYNELLYIYPNLIDENFLNLRLGLKCMILPEESYYSMGINEDEPLYKKSFYKGSVGLGKDADYFSTYIDYGFQYDIYDNLDGVVEPGNKFIHTVSGDFSSGPATSSMSPVYTITGFLLKVEPELTLVQDYTPWGVEGDLYEHNDNPAINLKTSFGYYIDLPGKQNLMFDIAWLRSINPYRDTRFSVGHGSATDNEHLSGYLPGELELDNALLTNFKYTYKIKRGRAVVYGKYDFLFDFTEKSIHQGVSLGSAFKLPLDIDIQGEVGLGFNSEGIHDPGFVFQLTALRLFYL